MHGHPGLFVFDGANLPRAVGVNPSSTIAALAERNVEHFLVAHDVPFAISEAEAEEIRRWSARAKGGDWALEPPRKPSPPIESQPIGVTFCEIMAGFHAPDSSTHGAAPIKVPEQGLFAELGLLPKHGVGFRGMRRDIPAEPDDYEAAYRCGRQKGSTIVLTLDAKIRDVVAFDADDQHTLQIEGTIDLGGATLAGKAPLRGLANLFVPLTLASYVGDDRIMYYDLTFDLPGSKGELVAYHLRGFKRLHANEGARASALQPRNIPRSRTSYFESSSAHARAQVTPAQGGGRTVLTDSAVADQAK